jgi:DNA-binding SARP family transcriptional activator/CheY-like chemotaxis protein
MSRRRTTESDGPGATSPRGGQVPAARAWPRPTTPAGRGAPGRPREAGCESPGGRGFAIRLFGPLAVEDHGRTLGPGDLGGRRPKQVLEILLAARGHPVPTDRIADLLWGDSPPENAAGAIQTFVSVLRRRLSSDNELARRLVATETEAYRFETATIDFDLDRFDGLHDRSLREPTDRARRSLEQALALVRGEVLEDEPYAVWAQELRGAYQSRVLGARLEAADAALAELHYAAALAHAQAAVLLDRFSERAYRSQMLSLYALGRQHEALEIYRRLRACLDEELGLEPSADTRALEAAILRQEDVRSLLPRPTLRVSGDTRAPSVRLLGRTTELDALERAARQALEGSFALLQIQGEAGLGKTRLLDELSSALTGVRLGRASCSALEQHLPYVPLATALREALPDVALDGQRLPALRRILPELCLHEPAPELAEVDALEALVKLIAEQAPLALLLDDLHWADAQTIAALSYLRRRGFGIPAVLVTALRSEHPPPDHPVRGLRPDLVLRLEPLTATELAPLGIPDLQEATGGNPRFLAAAIANGNRSELAAAVAEMLLDQCRAEGAWSHRVLRAASVLEQPFGPESLANLLRVDAAEVAEDLERLCERGIMRVDGLRFRFRYQLMREVLRARVSPARRHLLRERLDEPTEPIRPRAGERRSMTRG